MKENTNSEKEIIKVKLDEVHKNYLQKIQQKFQMNREEALLKALSWVYKEKLDHSWYI